MVADVLKKLSNKSIKKKTAMNELYAQDILSLAKAHHMYMSLVIYLRNIEETKFKDQNIKPLLILLGKIFALKQLSIDC